MHLRRQKSEREKHRDEWARLVNESPTLAEKFPKLKSLAAELEFLDSEKGGVSRQIKYKMKPESAKSVFRFSCPNSECVRGDFDLSDQLARAIGKKQKLVEGEMPCPGWLSKTTVGTVRCRVILRYKLRLAF